MVPPVCCCCCCVLLVLLLIVLVVVSSLRLQTAGQVAVHSQFSTLRVACFPLGKKLASVLDAAEMCLHRAVLLCGRLTHALRFSLWPSWLRMHLPRSCLSVASALLRPLSLPLPSSFCSSFCPSSFPQFPGSAGKLAGICCEHVLLLLLTFFLPFVLAFVPFLLAKGIDKPTHENTLKGRGGGVQAARRCWCECAPVLCGCCVCVWLCTAASHTLRNRSHLLCLDDGAALLCSS